MTGRSPTCPIGQPWGVLLERLDDNDIDHVGRIERRQLDNAMAESFNAL